MRQHAREKERAESRVTELEQRKRELEGTVVAIESCWNQVRGSFIIVSALLGLGPPVIGVDIHYRATLSGLKSATNARED